MFDLTEIQKRIEAVVGQSVSVTEGNDDWNLRLSYINRSQIDWSERFDWPQLYKETYGHLSAATGNATIALLADFRKLGGFPKFGIEAYPEIDPSERGRFSSGDKYTYVLGDPRGGYNLIVNYAKTQPSGASYFVPFYRTPASLSSGSDVSDCPNPDYLVQQSLYYYFLSNEDDRFQDARGQAERILGTMLESSHVKGKGYHNEVLNVDESKHNFKWGKN